MKKKVLLLFLAVCGFMNAQVVNIPDADFKNILLGYIPQIDTNNDGEIQVSEAEAVTELNIFSANFTNTTGIEAFRNLISLKCQQGVYTALNLASMTQLQHLDCSNSYQFSNLILPPAPNVLEQLHLDGTQVVLDLTRLGSLKHLAYYDIPFLITSLDLTSLHNLECVDVHESNLTHLNVTGLTNLQTLICSYNEFSDINLTGLDNLLKLKLSPSFSPFTALSVNHLTTLKHLECSGLGLNELNISNLVNLEVLDCSANNFNAINLSNNTALKTLNCSNNPLGTIDLSALTNLTTLNCYSNQLTHLNVSLLPQLKKLDCSSNLLNTLDLSALSALKELGCGSNNLSALDVSNNPLLESVYFAYNNLVSFDVFRLPILKSFNCTNNQISSLDFSQSHYLEQMYLSNNRFVTLDLSACGTSSDSDMFLVDFSENPLLTYINLKNGRFLDLMVGMNLDCPNLAYVCADEGNIPSVLQTIRTQGSNTIQVNSYCSFAPGGIHNTISGTIGSDANNNGCDASDPKFPSIKMTVNDGTTNGATFTNNTGNYSFYTATGNFTITPQFENAYFTISPTTAVVNFDTLDGSTQVQHFCVNPVGIRKDLEITMLATAPARPGFDATYQLVYKNKGNQTISGNVNLVFNDAVLDFVSAIPAITSQTLNNLNWSFTDLKPFESRMIDVVLNANGPMETPPVNIDDILNYTVSIAVENDETPLDNEFTLSEIVTGSYDPNDKTCLEGDTIHPDKIGGYVHYLIRFQNSGTAPAERVIIKDVIDTTKFDMTSLQLTSTSHPQMTKITGKTVEFFFQNINLPAEQDDEPGSHGFVAFKIKTKSNLTVGNTISNQADIFFDYNFPIVTNPATSTFATLGINEFKDASVVVSPNPVSDKLTISAKSSIISIQVFDLQGRLVQTTLENSKIVTLPFGKYNSSIYFVKIRTETGVVTEKIIRK